MLAVFNVSVSVKDLKLEYRIPKAVLNVRVSVMLEKRFCVLSAEAVKRRDSERERNDP